MKSLARLLLFVSAFSTASVQAAPPTNKEVQAALKVLKALPAAKGFFKKSYGYAIYPNVGRGSFAVGGAYGEGFVYKKNKKVAKTTLMQVSLGLGVGGEQYAQIIFFKDKAAFDRFAAGNLEMGARASATAGTKTAQGELGYADGVAIITVSKGGLILDASLAGQKFTFEEL